MTDLTVVFKVPEWLAAGLRSSELERVGGVIRDKLTKKVVAWLHEGDMVSTEPPSEILNGQLSQLMMQGQVLMGLQVANLAISAVGFAMIYRKLQRIEQQLDEMSSHIQEIKSEQDWVNSKLLLEHLAPIGAALQTLQEISYYHEQRFVEHQLLAADNNFSKAQTYFHQVLIQLINRRQEYRRTDEFAISYRAWLMAGQGRIQAMSELGEQQVALELAKSLKIEHANFGKRLTEMLGDPFCRLCIGKESSEASTIIQKLGQQAVQAHQILRGNVLQLDFMHKHKLLSTHEHKAAIKGHTGLLICIPT